MNPTEPLLLIKDAAAANAGAYSSGAVLYRMLTDADRTEPYLAITGNRGGSGYFSREAVPFTEVRQCVAGAPPGVALPSKTFAGAFVGRSTNNPGFLAAILRAEGLGRRNAGRQQDGPERHLKCPKTGTARSRVEIENQFVKYSRPRWKAEYLGFPPTPVDNSVGCLETALPSD